MVTKNTVLEVSLNLLRLKETLKDLTQLKEDAFKVFNDDFNFNKDLENCLNTSWRELAYWNYSSSKRYGHLSFMDYGYIVEIFKNFKKHNITHKDFCTSLESCKENVEKFTKKLNEDILEETKKIDKLYEEFITTTGEFKFIFAEDQIKQLILNNFLQS